jgi:hypothetical protein
MGFLGGNICISYHNILVVFTTSGAIERVYEFIDNIHLQSCYISYGLILQITLNNGELYEMDQFYIIKPFHSPGEFVICDSGELQEYKYFSEFHLVSTGGFIKRRLAIKSNGVYGFSQTDNGYDIQLLHTYIMFTSQFVQECYGVISYERRLVLYLCVFFDVKYKVDLLNILYECDLAPLRVCID